MTLAGQEIQRDLRRFVGRWRDYQGSERAEAQTFVNELFACYGVDRQAAGVRFEVDQVRPSGTHGFVDALWPGCCLIEMKRPSEAQHLDRHRKQAYEYWQHSSDAASNRPAVDYVVLCGFHAFEVWQPGQFPLDPRAAFALEQLPDRYETLLFLGRDRPLFIDGNRALTTEAAKRTVGLHRHLLERDAADADTLQSFILQTVWCLFASSLGLLRGHPVQRIVASLSRDASGVRSSAAELGHLFEVLARDDLRNQGGVYANLVYVDGGLFRAPALVHLDSEELQLLADIAAFDWSQVEPTIFGSLLEGFLPRHRAVAANGSRTQFGVHYTHEADIMKIVGPSIVEPWSARISGTTSVVQAREALEDLTGLRVLDPACGSGNFLYVAYRELRELERVARERITALAAARGLEPPDPAGLPRYPLSNLYGIEIDAFAVRVTRLVLWMGHKLAADRHGTPESPLPLPDLDRAIVQEDALRSDWPEVDVVIGNPPFNGSQNLRSHLGEEYLRWLEQTFGVGLRDYCTYWFRRTADHLSAGGRAGLVGTNSIAQGRGREAALDYVVGRGGVITDAVASQPWPGEAKVHVSIVNWIKEPAEAPARFRLGGVEAPGGIASDLVPIPQSTADAQRLEANGALCFQGVIRTGDGFLLDDSEATTLLGRPEAAYAVVVRRFLDNDDVTEDPRQQPTRWVIDFGTLTLEAAAAWPAALHLVRERVKPGRDLTSNAGNRRHWWQLERPRPAMRAALATRTRYVAIGSTGKRTLAVWCEPDWCPSNLVYAVALDDDYSFGVLTSSAHRLWARYRGSSLKSDPRYTSGSVFETYPWPDPSEAQRARIAAAAREVVAERAAACDGQRGLTAVYNLVDDGGYTNLADAHHRLDRAVAEAYGWQARVADDPLQVTRRLMDLNREITEGRRAYRPFPGRDCASEQGTLYLADERG